MPWSPRRRDPPPPASVARRRDPRTAARRRRSRVRWDLGQTRSRPRSCRRHRERTQQAVRRAARPPSSRRCLSLDFPPGHHQRLRGARRPRCAAHLLRQRRPRHAPGPRDTPRRLAPSPAQHDYSHRALRGRPSARPGPGQLLTSSCAPPLRHRDCRHARGRWTLGTRHGRQATGRASTARAPRKTQSGEPEGSPDAPRNPAATYSPRANPPKYHRRMRA